MAAAKKELIAAYAEVLTACGLTPSFTVAALARNVLAPKSSKNYILIEPAKKNSELVSVVDGVPVMIRVIPELRDLRSLRLSRGTTVPFIVTGHFAEFSSFKESIPDCESTFLETPTGEGRSSAIAGLKLARESNLPLIVFEEQEKPARDVAGVFNQYKWAVVAILLGIACLGLRYAGTLLHKHRFTKKYEEYQTYRNQHPDLDQQLGFLEFIKTNQPSYLDAIYALADAAPPGVKIDSLSMSRRGEVSFKGAVRDPQQMMEFRSKLIDSGAFNAVIVEEQTPTPDRQKLNVRMSAQWAGNLKISPSNSREKTDALSKKEARALTIATP